ncbi:MAG: ABC transporter ATP-binding protein [Bacteroidales bacterium]|nr:ABC transporter ATP-binding protein [Bacteroidales bacterium]
MIEVKDLSKAYDGVTVLNIPGLKIPKGESFGLVGNNGAGKTTFFRLMLDLIRANSGTVMTKGKNVSKDENWKFHTASYLDDGFLIDFLTPEEFFRFTANVRSLTEGDLSEFYILFKDFFNDEILEKGKLIRDLSRGNQKKVGIAATLMSDPEIIIMDEPFNSLDPTTQIRLKIILNDWRKDKNTTMLISSHDLNHVSEVCDRIVILDKGNIVKDIHSSNNTLKELEDYFYTQIYAQS